MSVNKPIIILCHHKRLPLLESGSCLGFWKADVRQSQRYHTVNTVDRSEDGKEGAHTVASYFVSHGRLSTLIDFNIQIINH
jgi:hypothetical protein